VSPETLSGSVPPSLVYKIINTAGAEKDQYLKLYFSRLEGISLLER
jgi:hypothetical protein